MFSKNLKYYRLRKQMSKKELAEKVNVTPMAITNYENGDRKPNMETMKALAKALDVRVTDFLAVRNGRIVFSHGGFRKSNSLSAEQQEYVREFVEEPLYDRGGNSRWRRASCGAAMPRTFPFRRR